MDSDEILGWIDWWKSNYCYDCLNFECKCGYSDMIACQWRKWKEALNIIWRAAEKTIRGEAECLE